jgi:D-alanyl-D-alanine carboxypeptidase (penicillin-binding protein 5/6)
MKRVASKKLKILIAAVAAALAVILIFPLIVRMTSASVCALSVPETSAEGMACVEAQSGRILYGKNMRRRRAPASTTKILTAITVIENTPDLDAVKKVPDKAVGVEGSSMYLERGEEFSVRDLLYGLMLRSGNDCAEALAILTSGSKEKFASLMNKTAVKAGASESNFVTPHGLDDKEHYTTAIDLARITAYALKNGTFADIVKTKRRTAKWKGRDYDRLLINKNRLLYSFAGADGVKTGYTKKAGRCFVSSATRDGMRVICVVLGCGPMFEDCGRIMETAFSEYRMTEVLKAGAALGAMGVKDGKSAAVAVGVKESVFYPLKNGEPERLEIKADIAPPRRAPVKSGVKAGKISLKLENMLLYSADLYTIESVPPRSYLGRLGDIVGAW